MRAPQLSDVGIYWLIGIVVFSENRRCAWVYVSGARLCCVLDDDYGILVNVKLD